MLTACISERAKRLNVPADQRKRIGDPPHQNATCHGNFGKALDAQCVYVEQLVRMKPAWRSTQ